jgi:hypothetical protein
MLIGGQEFPEECPKKCPGKDDNIGQGGLCYRCPIFNCQKFDYTQEDGKVFKISMLRPDQYREDWAKNWKKWFDTGMKGYPQLPLQ